MNEIVVVSLSNGGGGEMGEGIGSGMREKLWDKDKEGEVVLLKGW